MSVTIQTFVYQFTDNKGTQYDLSMTAENSVEAPNTYTVRTISGTTKIYGEASSAVTGLSSTYNGPDNLLGVDDDQTYDPVTLWSALGVSFNTADGNSWNLYSVVSETSPYGMISNSGQSKSTGVAGIVPIVITDPTTQITPCYLPGTLILTTQGEVSVEHLKVGDLLPTLAGKDVSIKWIGTLTVAGYFLTKEASPVCIQAGALGEGLPKRDLQVSALHSIKIGDYLVDARLLVNGVTITQQKKITFIDYYHIDLGDHHCIRAEGAWAESFLERNDNRGAFENFDEFCALHPDHSAPVKPQKCLPHLDDAQDPRLAELLNTLRAHIPQNRVTTDPDLHLVVDGKRIDPERRSAQEYVFKIPAGTKMIRLKSRTNSPSHFGQSRDARELGFCVNRLTAQTMCGSVKITLEPHHPALRQGFHLAEKNVRVWTRGDAVLPDILFGDGTEAMLLTIQGQALARYYLEGIERAETQVAPNLPLLDKARA